MITSRFLKTSLIALAATTLSACVSLLPEAEPVAVYRLGAPAPQTMPAGVEPVIVQVQRPLAPAGLSGDEIAIEVNNQHLAYMAGARWIAPAPVIVQNLIVDTFHAQADRVEPVRPSDAIRGRFELRMDMREFEAAYDNGSDAAPLIRVRIAARLIESNGRELAASRVFSAQVRASANRVPDIIQAFNSASTEVAADLARWASEAAAR